MSYSRFSGVMEVQLTKTCEFIRLINGLGRQNRNDSYCNKYPQEDGVSQLYSEQVSDILGNVLLVNDVFKIVTA